MPVCARCSARPLVRALWRVMLKPPPAATQSASSRTSTPCDWFFGGVVCATVVVLSECMNGNSCKCDNVFVDIG